jgi:hypothetical protein
LNAIEALLQEKPAAAAAAAAASGLISAAQPEPASADEVVDKLKLPEPN